MERMKGLIYITDKITEAFKKEDVKKKVLKRECYKINKETGLDDVGFSYVASEIIYRLFGGSDTWIKASIFKSVWGHGTHHYLVCKLTGDVVDVTSNQFKAKGIEIPYKLGVRGGFSTKDYSKASRILAESVGITLDIDKPLDLYGDFLTNTSEEDLTDNCEEDSEDIVRDIISSYSTVCGELDTKVEELISKDIMVIYPNRRSIPKSLKFNKNVKSIHENLTGYSKNMVLSDHALSIVFEDAMERINTMERINNRANRRIMKLDSDIGFLNTYKVRLENRINGFGLWDRIVNRKLIKELKHSLQQIVNSITVKEAIKKYYTKDIL